MHTDRCGNTRRQKYRARGSGKEDKTHEFMYRDKTNVEPEMLDYTSNIQNQRSSNKIFKEKFESVARKTFNRYAIKDSYALNVTHYTERTTVRYLKPER
jgi:hypothetical protein